jgi:hypothetical protein
MRRSKWAPIVGVAIFSTYAVCRFALPYVARSGGWLGLVAVFGFAAVGVALIGWLMVFADNSRR